MKKKNVFSRPWYMDLYYLSLRIKNKVIMAYKHWKYPENVWYGGGLSRESALSGVGKGWSELINKLYDAKPKYVNVTQVKEKFAGLRFYVMSAPEWYWDLISYYENESEKICEVCGKPGKVREDRSWILTLCDECDKIDKEQREKQILEWKAKNKINPMN